MNLRRRRDGIPRYHRLRLPTPSAAPSSETKGDPSICRQFIYFVLLLCTSSLSPSHPPPSFVAGLGG